MQKCWIMATAVAAALGYSSLVSAAAFTPGDIVVYRSGTGTENQVTAGNTLFIDEYTPAGGFVQSFQFNNNTTSGTALVAQGNSSADGSITRSENGTYLAVPGYNISAASQGNATAVVNANKSIGRISATGVLNLTTTFSSGNDGIRGVTTSNGTDFWAATLVGGIQYTTLGNAGTAATVVGPATNAGRTVNIFGGQLYAGLNSAASDPNFQGIKAVGSGLPTSLTTYSTPGSGGGTIGASPYNFYFCDLSSSVAGLDTLYSYDDTGKTIQKYSLIAGAWTLNGTTAVVGAPKGLTGQVNGTTVKLFLSAGATASTGTGSISVMTDSAGYNVVNNGSQSAAIVTVAARKFQGIAMAPTPHFSVTTTAGPVSRGTVAIGTTIDLEAGIAGDNNGQVQVTGNTTSQELIASLDIERGDGGSPADFNTQIATLVSHLNEATNTSMGQYVATNLLTDPSVKPAELDNDFEVAIVFQTVDPSQNQFINFDLFRDTGLDIDRINVSTPEPTSLAALSLGGALLLGRRRRARG